jgi:integrase/recombinase XerD
MLNYNLLEPEELEYLYYSYKTVRIEFPSSPSVAMRNKVITGFMVYQGLNATALKFLTIDNIHLEKGTIYIPSTRKTNSRTLELKSWQIDPLVQYLQEYSKKNLKTTHKPYFCSIRVGLTSLHFTYLKDLNV